MSVFSRINAWLRAPVSPPKPAALRWTRPELGEDYAGDLGTHLDLGSHENVVDGLLYPNWEAVIDRVDDVLGASEVDLDALWGDIALDWFERLASGLGGTFRTLRSPNFLALHDMPERHADLLLSHCERLHGHIAQFLGPAMNVEGHGPIGVVQLSQPEDFYRFIDPYMDSMEGQMSSIGGMFVQKGYGHVVLLGSDLLNLEPVLTHEIAHASLQHQGLPLWLDEALAMGIEELAHGETMHLESASEARALARHWDPATIQAFWSGEAFRDPTELDESAGWDTSVSTLSYILATALFRVLSREVSDEAGGLPRLIELAGFEDAGEGAARACLGAGLGDVVAQVLGPGDWGPDLQRLGRLFRAPRPPARPSPGSPTRP